jgi:predicted S18 family serine protease
MTRVKIAAFMAFLFFSFAVFEYFQASELKEDIKAKNSLINLLDSDYQDLQSDYGSLQDELEEAQAEIKEQSDARSIGTHILGVRGGTGVIIPLEIEVKNGTERIFIDVSEVFLEGDVQGTAKTAFALADVKSKGGLTQKDAYIHIVNPYKKSLSLSGSSSGAVMTMALLALGKNATLKEDVVITGSIQGDGSIGSVLYISQKAEAAKSLNATVMLVPAGQKISVSGIELIEVSNVEEAMEYMLE